MGLTRFETLKRHNRLLILVPGITALVSTIALNRSRQHSQSWTYLGLLWMMEMTAPLTLLLLRRLTALLSLPNLLPILQLRFPAFQVYLWTLKISKLTRILPTTPLLSSFYLYFIPVILRTTIVLKLFWQTIVFGFLYVVVCVAWYITSVASVIYIHAYVFFFFNIFNQCFFRALSKHSRLFGNPVSLLTGKLRQYSLVRHFSRAVSLVVLPKRRLRSSASLDSLTGCDDLVIFL